MMRKTRHSGFSLLEAAVALIIVAALAGLLVPMADSLVSTQRANQTASELQTIYTAIIGNPQQGTYGYLGDVGDYPNDLADLVSSSNTGWNGPYISGPRTNNGILVDPYGGAVEYVQVTSTGVADYLGLVSKGPDLTSSLGNQNSNARSAFTSATYPWLSGYSATVANVDNILYPNIIDSPGQVRYQSLGTLSYDLYNFDLNSKVNTNVPGCPALYQIKVTSVPRQANDSFTLMYNPGGASVDLIQGLWTVSITNTATGNMVFNEQAAVQPGGSNTRTVYLPPIDSSNTATFTLTVNNQYGAGVDVYDYTNTKVGATLASGNGSFTIKGCSPVYIKKDAAGVGTTVLDSLTMPYKAYTRRVDPANSVVDLVVTDTGSANVNTMLKLYEGGTNLSTGVLIGTVSFKGNKKVKRFYNVKVNDYIMFEDQAGNPFGGQTYGPVTAVNPNTKTVP
jgi:type II secretory pathway pseudopilin PulG